MCGIQFYVSWFKGFKVIKSVLILVKYSILVLIKKKKSVTYFVLLHHTIFLKLSFCTLIQKDIPSHTCCSTTTVLSMNFSKKY